MPTDPPGRTDKPLAVDPQPQAKEDQRGSWTSEELLKGQHEVLIRHGGETYRLRLTRQGKLILHK